jgi:hypothetical protein
MSPNWDSGRLLLKCYKSHEGKLCGKKLGEHSALDILMTIGDAPLDQLTIVDAGLAQRSMRSIPMEDDTIHGHAEAAPTSCTNSELTGIRKMLDYLVEGFNVFKESTEKATMERISLQMSLKEVTEQMKIMDAKIRDLHSALRSIRSQPRSLLAVNSATPGDVVTIMNRAVTQPHDNLSAKPAEPAAQDKILVEQLGLIIQPASLVAEQNRPSGGMARKSTPFPVGTYANAAKRNKAARLSAEIKSSNAPAANSSPPTMPTENRRVERALQSLLVEHQRLPTQYAYIYVTGIRRQPVRAIARRFRDLGISKSRLNLNFVEDSNTLVIMVPEQEKDQISSGLTSYGLTVRDEMLPEQVAAIDGRRFAELPDDKRESLAKKRTAQHFRRLALKCPVRSLQRFLCGEIRRLGETAPTRRERNAAERLRRERAERRAQPETDAEGFTRVTNRRRSKRNSGVRANQFGATDAEATFIWPPTKYPASVIRPFRVDENDQADEDDRDDENGRDDEDGMADESDRGGEDDRGDEDDRADECNRSCDGSGWKSGEDDEPAEREGQRTIVTDSQIDEIFLESEPDNIRMRIDGAAASGGSAEETADVDHSGERARDGNETPQPKRTKLSGTAPVSTEL